MRWKEFQEKVEFERESSNFSFSLLLTALSHLMISESWSFQTDGDDRTVWVHSDLDSST